MIVLGGSSMHKGANGWQGGRAIGCLPALTGNLGVPGGGFGPRHGASAHGQALNTDLLAIERRPPGDDMPNQMPRITEAHAGPAAARHAPARHGHAVVVRGCGRVGAGLARQDLVVSYDLFLNDTARRFADVDAAGDGVARGARLQEHQHAPLPDAEDPGRARAKRSPSHSCCAELAGRLGIADFWPWASDAGPIDAILDHPSTGHATVAASPRRAESARSRSRPSRIRTGRSPRRPARSSSTPSAPLRSACRRCPCTTTCRCRRIPLTLRQGRTLTHFHGFYDHGRALPTLAKADPGAGAVDRACGRRCARDRGRRADPHLQRARRDDGAGAGDRRGFRPAPSGCATDGTGSTADVRRAR